MIIDESPAPVLDYRTKLAISTLKRDRDNLAKNYGNALIKFIDYERSFYPHNPDCSSCTFLHQLDPKTCKYHRNCPVLSYSKDDLYICDNCIRYINVSQTEYDDICFGCTCSKTKLDDLEKTAEKDKLFYVAYDLHSLIG